jgi:FkbM family methyltransferase
MKQLLQKAANRLGYRISKIREPFEHPYIDVLELILQDYLKQTPEICFVQIGANDGATADPVTDLIRRYQLPGLLVEPQPRIFDRLVENYQDQKQLRFENSAICDRDGTITFYAIREQEPKLPMWCYQIANLDRDRMLSLLSDQKKNLNLPADVESLIEAIEVPAMTFKTLLAKHQIERVDLLVLDTLGFDFEIIKSIPFDLMKPAIINFEHTFLSAEDQKACYQYLAHLGYSLIEVSVDAIAYLKGQTRKGFYTL